MRLHSRSAGKLVSVPAEPVFDYEADVCVLGLGTAGALAAIVAAECGASVIGVERTTLLGGAGTAGVYDYYYGTQGGRVMELNEECYRRCAKQYMSSGGREIRPEAVPGSLKSTVLLETVLAAGCQILLDTTVLGVYCEENTVCGLLVFDGKKQKNIRCKVLIDGADGIACQLAGCEMLPGRPYDNKTMTYSRMQIVLSDEGKYVRFNYKFCGLPDSDSVLEWSQNMLGSYRTLLQERYEKREAVLDGPMLGLREVRNVHTDSVYTFRDVAAGIPAEKPLFYGFSPMDNTNPKERESWPMQDWHFLGKMHCYGISAAMPMGALIPAGKEGLLVVGKATGLGHDLSSCLRMKFDMEKCGEAAGRIAALACRDNCSVREVSYPELLAQLKESGCFNLEHDIGIANLNEPVGTLWNTRKMPETLEEYRQELSSTEPGPAIWWTRNHATDELREALLEWTGSENRLLAENSAIALGVAGDERCVPALRGILKRDPVVDSFRVAQVNTPYSWIAETPFCNYTKALCLIGRFHDEESVPLLEKILADEGAALVASVKVGEIGKARVPKMEADEFVRFARAALEEIQNPTQEIPFS